MLRMRKVCEGQSSHLAQTEFSLLFSQQKTTAYDDFEVELNDIKTSK